MPQGLQAFQIEESAKDIRHNVENIRQTSLSYEEYMKKLGGHLGTTVNAYNTAYKELGKIDKDVFEFPRRRVGIEALALDKPKISEE